MSYRIKIQDEKNRYELTELAKMFAPAEELEFSDGTEEETSEGASAEVFAVPGPEKMDRNAQKRALFSYLAEKTGVVPDWGTLTGVRPGKLFSQLAKRLGSPDNAEEALKKEYFVTDSKIGLLRNTWEVQQRVKCDKSPAACGVYVGIPFCPTRCLYCSFTSNRFKEDAAAKYLKALYKEIAAVSEMMEQRGLYAESIYIGGGTPTSLTDSMFSEMVQSVSGAFLRPKTVEFTVECGRPDTITEAKLKAIKTAGAGRISINPQTMKQRTLELIGRHHTPVQIEEAFALARSCGMECINMDLIAGLPQESPEDFEGSLRKVTGLGPENITVHTLAVKRGSRLIEEDSGYSYRQGRKVRQMLEKGSAILKEEGYEPYYLYRQKHMAGNFENVGYCRGNTASLYNMRIMEEDQTIIALGAGGISKVYYPAEDRLERVANVSNYEIYIDRIDEMIKRKEEGL